MIRDDSPKKQAARFKRAVCFFLILCHFMIITVLFSRTKFKTNVEDTLGLRGPRLVLFFTLHNMTVIYL